MSNVFDVRKDDGSKICKIVFANAESLKGYVQANFLFQPDRDDVKSVIGISDGVSGVVSIHGKEHAQHLIKALEKAIELKWLV